MNVYMVKTKDQRTYTEHIDEHGGPEVPYWPHVLVVAETTGQAKSEALFMWRHDLYSGVYSDDYMNLRTTLLVKDTDLPFGVLPENDDTAWLWCEYSLRENPGESTPVDAKPADWEA